MTASMATAAARLIRAFPGMLFPPGSPLEAAAQCNPQVNRSAPVGGLTRGLRVRVGFKIGRRSGRSMRGGRQHRPVGRKKIPNPAGGCGVCSTRTGSSQGETVTGRQRAFCGPSILILTEQGSAQRPLPAADDGKRRTCVDDPQPDRRWLNWLSAFGRRAARGPGAVRDRRRSGRFGWGSQPSSRSPA